MVRIKVVTDENNIVNIRQKGKGGCTNSKLNQFSFAYQNGLVRYKAEKEGGQAFPLKEAILDLKGGS